MQSSQLDALMMASNILVERSATGARRVCPTPGRPNKDPRSHHQSATVWWSTRSSKQHWRVGEWRPTVNKIADNNREQA